MYIERWNIMVIQWHANQTLRSNISQWIRQTFDHVDLILALHLLFICRNEPYNNPSNGADLFTVMIYCHMWKLFKLASSQISQRLLITMCNTMQLAQVVLTPT